MHSKKITPRALARFGVAFMGALLLVLATGCATDKSVIAQADNFNSGIKPAEIKNSDVDGYLQKVGDRILAAAKEADQKKYGPKTHFKKGENGSWMFADEQFHLVNSKTLNAFTTGGHHVYIYNELFQQCKSEDELAAVMAHEFGHVYCRHVQKGTDRQMALLGAAGLLGGAGYLAGGKENGAQYAQTAASLGAAGGQFLNMGFTRGDEAQADETGFYFYYLAGWDVHHFADFFEHMIQAGYDKTPAIASDHPTLASRVEATKKRVADLKDPNRYLRDPIASPSEFRRYQDLANQSAKNIPDDKQVLQTQNLLQALPRSCWVPYEPPDQKAAAQQLLNDAQREQDRKQGKAAAS